MERFSLVTIYILRHLPQLLPVRVHERQQLRQRSYVAKINRRGTVRCAFANSQNSGAARLYGILACHKFSNVSALVYVLYKATI